MNNSTLDEIQMQESQVMIDFFHTPVEESGSGFVVRRGIDLSES